MATLPQFAQRINKIADAVPGNVNGIKQAVARSILRTVVLDTPVDTSQARSRWQVGINASPVAVYGPFFPGKGGSTAQPSSEAAIEAGNAEIARSLPGNTIIVGNNVPYIRRLNDGYSKQAPANFVQRSIANGIRALRGMKVIR